MKKMSLFFAVAALLAVATSAFTKPKFDTTIYGVDAAGTKHAVLLSQQNSTWECNSGAKFCTYSDINLMHPREATQSYQFTLIP